MFDLANFTQCVSSKHGLIECFASLDGGTAYAIILGVLFACGMGLPIPEDITLIAAGILAALEKISLGGAIFIGLFGVLAGDSLLFFTGRFMGRRVFEVSFMKKIFPEHRIIVAEKRILENSKFICFVARFLPGLRAPIYLTSGVMGVKPSVFLALDGLAAIISVPIWVYVGYWLGAQWDENLAIIKELQIFLVAGVLGLIIAYIIYKKKTSQKEQKTA